MSDDILGYASFPDERLAVKQGEVIDYCKLPGGADTLYNQGRRWFMKKDTISTFTLSGSMMMAYVLVPILLMIHPPGRCIEGMFHLHANRQLYSKWLGHHVPELHGL
jgi:hypothetical protein